MKMGAPKQREWSEGLLDRAIEFHGHGGPFMVVGLRMGLTALKRLDARGWFDVRCHILLRYKPPDSCVIDGIQCSTGCTMGKHNIELEESEGIAADFYKEREHLRIILRQELLEKIRSTLAEEREELVEALMTQLIVASDWNLFEIS